jgi:lipoprotein-anchoring transpeptidase ErfK/SrfK
MMPAARVRRAGVRWSAALVAAIVCVVVAGGGARPAGAAEIGPPTKAVSWSARILAPVTARVQPSLKARKVAIVQPTAPLAGGPSILLVLDRRVVDNREWIKVLLPIRPNGSSGWIPADVARFRENPMRVVIDQSERRTYVYRAGKLVYATRNAVGKVVTPTPTGHFAIAEKVLLPPGGFLGPVVLAATGYSEVLNEYAGGNGRFALHGTSLPGLIGTRASNGCIRHRNDTIVKISRLIAPGTPLTIRT